MANTSATGGFLLDTSSPAPISGVALEDLLSATFAGITGLSNSLIRPRWQPIPPKQPDPSVDWLAFGITRIRQDAGPAITHDPTGDGVDDYVRHQEFEVGCTFYGPNGQGNADLLLDGLGILQNLEAIGAYDIAFVGAGDAVQVPELFNQQWIKRHDRTFTFRRKLKRNYATLNILSAPFAVTTN